MVRQAWLPFLAASAATIFLAPPQARADFVSGPLSVSQTLSYGSANSPINTSFEKELDFAQFGDQIPQVPKGAKLDTVTISVDASLVGQAQASYSQTNPQSITIFSYAHVALSGPAGVSLDVPLDYQNQAMLSGPDHSSYNAPISDNQKMSLVIQSANFGEFEGSGTVGLTVDVAPVPKAVDQLSISSGVLFSGSQGSGSVTQQGYGSVTITYTYTLPPPIPEPAGIVLLAGGGGILMLARRHARRGKDSA